jgi:hypothetical protein
MLTETNLSMSTAFMVQLRDDAYDTRGILSNYTKSSMKTARLEVGQTWIKYNCMKEQRSSIVATGDRHCGVAEVW